MKPLTLLPWLALCLKLVTADDLAQDQVCMSACQEALQSLTFNDTSIETDPYAAQCTNIFRVKSTYAYAEYYCQPSDVAPGFAYLNEDCEQYGGVTMPPYLIISNMTRATISQLRHVTVYDLLSGESLAEVVLPSATLFGLAYRTIDIWAYEVSAHHLYSRVMYIFWGIVVSVGMGGRILSFSGTIATSRVASDLEESSPTGSFKRLTYQQMMRNWYRRHVVLPANFNFYTLKPSKWYTVPPRIQSATIFSFVFINVVLCSINYHAFKGNMYYNDIYTQRWRYIADRTGIIAIANLSMIWLFGTHNNFLLWITGWDFATFNNFHRWVARVATLEAIVHAIAYTVLRARHVKIFEGEYNGYIWPCVAIWSFDRFLRIARIIALNVKFWNVKANVTCSPGSNVVRFEVPHSSGFLKPKAGCYYYIYTFNDLRFWESHRFTLASYMRAGSRLQSSPSVAHLSDSTILKVAIESITPVSKEDDLNPTPTQTASTSTLSFLIRPYDGFTSRLQKAAVRANSASPPAVCIMRVLVEGPYGEGLSLRHFQHVLFIAGGTGITIPLSQISIRGQQTMPRIPMSIIWAVRERAFFDDVCNRELNSITDLQVDAYITGSKMEGEPDCARPVGDSIRVQHERPDVAATVLEAAAEGGVLMRGKTALVVCGPSSMTSEAKAALLKAIGQKGNLLDVEFFEESFSW
ncbi:MAG: hypothetical protein M1818_008227 [Claussenomyces sp. TS43310]|nr:MAG: hypothetical protein M1818_008227 [Claussenomyces sp. TS43310]